MSIILVNDGDLLLAKAQAADRSIEVSTYHVVVPDEHGVRRPALLLQYSLTVSNENEPEGPMTWSFQEVAPADKHGRVNLIGTLFDRLQRQSSPSPVDFAVATRSGSL